MAQVQEAMMRHEEKMRRAERAMYMLELERGWPSRIFEGVQPGQNSPDMMRYAKMKYNRGMEG